MKPEFELTNVTSFVMLKVTARRRIAVKLPRFFHLTTKLKQLFANELRVTLF